MSVYHFGLWCHKSSYFWWYTFYNGQTYHTDPAPNTTLFITQAFIFLRLSFCRISYFPSPLNAYPSFDICICVYIHSFTSLQVFHGRQSYKTTSPQICTKLLLLFPSSKNAMTVFWPCKVSGNEPALGDCVHSSHWVFSFNFWLCLLNFATQSISVSRLNLQLQQQQYTAPQFHTITYNTHT